MPFQSIEKIKIQKQRFYNSKGKATKEANSSIQMKPRIANRFNKEQTINVEEKKVDLAEDDLEV